MVFKQFNIFTTKKQELIDITEKVKKIVRDFGIKEGLCMVYVPHATAGILVNENYDPSVCEDIINKLEEIIPSRASYKHDAIDNNAHAHIKASIIGPSETILISNEGLQLGGWQGIALAEFDGPRNRTVFVKIIKG